MVSTHLKNISQIGSFLQVGIKIKNVWNHHPDFIRKRKAPFQQNTRNGTMVPSSTPFWPPFGKCPEGWRSTYSPWMPWCCRNQINHLKLYLFNGYGYVCYVRDVCLSQCIYYIDTSFLFLVMLSMFRSCDLVFPNDFQLVKVEEIFRKEDWTFKMNCCKKKYQHRPQIAEIHFCYWK